MRPRLFTLGVRLTVVVFAIATAVLVLPGAVVRASGGPGAVELFVTEGNYDAPSMGSVLRIDPTTHAVVPLQPPGQEGVAMGFVTVAGTSLYWGGSEPALGIPGVRRANLDGSAAQLVVASWMPMGVAVDETHGKLYWAEAAQHAVRRSNLDGSAVEEIASGVGCCFIASPMGLALDVAHGKVYWANMAMHTIQRSDLDGANVETLVTVFGWPSGLAIDPITQKLYWTEQGGAIMRSNLDGTQVEPVLVDLQPAVMGLAIDPVGRTMYWTVQPGRVMRANLDGSGVETVASGLAAVSGIAVRRVSQVAVSGHGRFNTEGNGQVSFTLSNQRVSFDRIRGQRFSFTGAVEGVTGEEQTATLTGTGSWNGQSGYGFEATVVDKGGWGRLEDTISVVIRDPAGAVAFTSFGPQVLKQGDITVSPAASR